MEKDIVEEYFERTDKEMGSFIDRLRITAVACGVASISIFAYFLITKIF